MAWTSRLTSRLKDIGKSIQHGLTVTKNYILSRKFFRALEIIFRTEANTYVNLRIISRFRGRAVYYPLAIFLGTLNGPDSLLGQTKGKIAKNVAVGASTFINGSNTLFSILYTVGTLLIGLLRSGDVSKVEQNNEDDSMISLVAAIITFVVVTAYTARKMHKIIYKGARSESEIFAKPIMLAAGRSAEAVRPCIYYGSVNEDSHFTAAYYNLLLFLASSTFGLSSYILYKWFHIGGARFDRVFDAFMSFLNLFIAGTGLNSTINIGMAKQKGEEVTMTDIYIYVIPSLILGIAFAIGRFRVIDTQYYMDERANRLRRFSLVPESGHEMATFEQAKEPGISPSNSDPRLFGGQVGPGFRESLEENQTDRLMSVDHEEDSLREEQMDASLMGWNK